MKIQRIFLLVFVLWTSVVFAQGFETPRQAVENHLTYLQDENYYPSKAKISLMQIKDVDVKELEHRAKQLKQIFDALGDKIILREVSNNRNYKDSTSQINKYPFGSLHLEQGTNHHEYLDKIYLEKVNGKWVYSAVTVEQIPKIYKEVFPFGMHVFSDFTNELSHDKFLGLYYWQYIGLVIIILLALLLYKVLNVIFNKVLVSLLKKYGHELVADQYIQPVVAPITVWVLSFLLAVLIPVLHLPVVINKWILVILNLTTTLFFTIILYRFVNIVADIMAKLAEKTESTLDDQLVPLARKVLKFFAILAGTLFMLRSLNFDILPLLTGLSIGGLAFALAAQDMIKNFFGSLMIFVDRPFQMGDWITGKGLDGDVEEVGFRSTRIRTFHNSVISVPNGLLADMTIDNMGLRKYRRYKTYLSITYGTPTEKIDAFVEGLREIVETHPDTRKDSYHVYFNTFNSSSLDVLFYIFFKVPDWGAELKARHEVNIQIMKLAEELGVEFAFNTQTLHIESMPEK
ncbi:MAG: mechanosensitive ion channel family protein [Cytophagales bacterium]|nr:mechanosensitive ion channel family protein [Cytophagales bacterium]